MSESGEGPVASRDAVNVSRPTHPRGPRHARILARTKSDSRGINVSQYVVTSNDCLRGDI